MKRNDKQMREAVDRFLSQSPDPEQIQRVLDRFSSGQGTREDMRVYAQKIVDSVLKTLEQSSESVDSYLFHRGEVRDEEERRSLDEAFVVVSRQGLRDVLTLVVEDGIGLTPNFELFRKVVEALPEESEQNTGDRRDLCSTDCPRFCQGDCPFDKIDDCPQYQRRNRNE